MLRALQGGKFHTDIPRNYKGLARLEVDSTPNTGCRFDCLGHLVL